MSFFSVRMPVELSGGDVDAQLVQLFQEQWLGDVLVVILMDDETDQGRSEKRLLGRTPSGSGATRFRPSGLRQRSRR